MAEFEEEHIYPHEFFHRYAKIWRRFIDDVFCEWEGPLERLLTFFEYINNIWPELKLTITHDQQTVNFLDTSVYKNEDGLINTDIYSKSTDRNSILHFESSHPESVKRAIPKSQFQRVCRIVTDLTIHQNRLQEMEDRFQNRGYPHDLLVTSREEVTHLDTSINRQEKRQDKKVYTMREELSSLESKS